MMTKNVLIKRIDKCFSLKTLDMQYVFVYILVRREGGCNPPTLNLPVIPTLYPARTYTIFKKLYDYVDDSYNEICLVKHCMLMWVT